MNSVIKYDKYDLPERTKSLGINIFKLLKPIKYSKSNYIIVNQLLSSGFSVGANYNEATECESRSDFIHKISISKKEIKEVLYWLDISYECLQDIDVNKLVNIKSEAHELLLIFAKIVKTSKLNSP